MKRTNIINIILLIVLIICLYYSNYETNKNLKKIEENFIKNYNTLNNKNLAYENEKLTAILDMEKTNLKIGVVRGNFINPYEEFIINKGLNHDIQNGCLVMNETRLIGFVTNAHSNYSNVELLENMNKKISVKINENYGILENVNKKLIITGMNGKNLKIGDSVYTSGLTNILGDVYIGKISKIIENDDTFRTKIYLEIEKNYDEYKYLMVVKK